METVTHTGVTFYRQGCFECIVTYAAKSEVLDQHNLQSSVCHELESVVCDVN